jgi:hypothetical protein
MTGDWAYNDVNKYLAPASYFDNNQLSRTHIIRMNGTYTLPLHFNIGVIYSIQSGATNGPITKTLPVGDPQLITPTTLTLSNGRVVSNPLSTSTRLVCARADSSCFSRTPFLHIFNLRLGKTFKMGERQSIEFNTDLFNVFNKGTPLSWATKSQASALFGTYSSSVQSPRAVEVMLRYRF